MRIAVCGGVYSNPFALDAFCRQARAHGAQRLYCLGDLGGYGAEPEAVWSLLTENDVVCVAGNYDVAIAAGGPDCGCGYRDPRDQQYAQVMYDYTLTHTSRQFATWMGTLPTERREIIEGHEVHFVHGSPLAVNDFWWESLSADAHSLRASNSGADIVFATHSGLPWIHRVDDTLVVNVGVIGRPANDGTTEVCYALVDLDDGSADARILALRYDWRAQANSMRRAGLPEAFVQTNETGWWTTCLEILPIAERSHGRYHVYDSSVPMLLAASGAVGPWEDEQPDLPVRSLVGSPLFPARIWCDLPKARAAVRRADAVRAGIVEMRKLSRGCLGPYLRAEVVRPELTLTDRGWFLHPELRDGPPLTRVGAESAVDRSDVAGAVRSAVHHVLSDLQEVGALTPPRYCVA